MPRPMIETLETRRLLAASPLPDLRVSLNLGYPYPVVWSGAMNNNVFAYIANWGNAVAAGKCVIQLVGNGTTWASPTVRLHIKPGRSQRVTFHFKLPDYPHNADGSKYLITFTATADAGNSIAEQDKTNNSASMTVSAATPADRKAYRKLVSTPSSPPPGWFVL